MPARVAAARLEARARDRAPVVLALQPALVVPVEGVLERGGARRYHGRQGRRDGQQRDDAKRPDRSLSADPSAHCSTPWSVVAPGYAPDPGESTRLVR